VRLATLLRLVVFGSLLSTAAYAQGTAVLTGTVTDAATGKPVADVVVTATSPALQGEEIVVTDNTGLYRIPQLPPGAYTLRLEKEQFKPYSRGDINLRSDRTIRLNVQMQPESVQAEEVVVVGKSPTVDVGSTTTGLNVGKDFVNNIPFIQPNGAGTRSFESLAAVAPQVNSDLYGFGISGGQSPENSLLIDGISVNDPAYGSTARYSSLLSGASLPVDFIEEVNVITGGYMPEYGRSTGGVLSGVTKSGSNEFHGSIFGNFTPGILTGPQPAITRDANVFAFKGYDEFGTPNRIWNSGDFGVELGGPILKDRLWFYAGFSPSIARNVITRSINGLQVNADGSPALDSFGNQKYFPLCAGPLNADGSCSNYAQQQRFADTRAYNYIAKLTFLISPNQNIALSVSGAPKTSDQPSFNPRVLSGFKESNDNLDLSLKYTAGFLDKHLLIDGTVGWHHQSVSTGIPDDGTDIGSVGGSGGTPGVIYRRNSDYASNYSVLDFETFPANSQVSQYCEPAGSSGVVKCPATSPSSTYQIGGAGYMDHELLDRVQGKVVVTYLLNLLGHMVIKGGADYQRTFYDVTKDYGGGDLLRQSLTGSAFRDYRQYGYFTSPDVFVSQGGPGTTGVHQTSSSSEFGAFVQDSWSIMDVVTLNAGLRYDTQQLFAGDGTLGMSLNNELSPRVGLIYDFTQRGQSKVFASYARYYESVPLDIADRGLTGEFQGGFYRSARPGAVGNGNPGCDPLKNISQTLNECADKSNYLPITGPASPSQYGLVTGSGKSPVDPNLQPQSNEEYMLGGEYELIQDGRLGATYTHRNLQNVIEDMSRDEGTTYFIGNPGYGIATDFPIATRHYDAVTVYFTKAFADLWQAQVSYTWSSLWGNYAGLFRPETGQLDPNANSDFDLISLLPNRTGPLPGDITHVIKAFGAKEFVLNGMFSIVLGLAYTGHSGTPLSYLASHPIYGPDESFVLPRGSAGRTPWVHSIDGKLAGVVKITKANSVQLSVDIFNMFNFAGVTGMDQTFSNADVLPYTPNDPNQPIAKTLAQACIAGNNPNCQSPLRQYKLDPSSGNPIGTEPVTDSALNPNFKRITAYQSPLTVRFGVKVTF
jgi:hypothetical protein